MKQTTLAVIACLLASAPSFAHESIYTDNIVVTASRIPQSRESVLADVTVIEHDEIAREGQSTLVELLQKQPGIEISNTGGTGKESSVYLRGTNANHIVVLVDGLRINSLTLGSTAFENIPLGQIERIEILRGPASSLYGADAIGGVIQIFTKRGEGAPKITAFVGYGSYDTRKAEASVSGSHTDTHYALNISAQDTEGLSALKNGKGFDVDKDPYRNRSFSASLSHQINESNEIGLQFLQSDGHNHFDCYYKDWSGVVQTDGKVCVSDQMLRSYGITSRNRFLPSWQSTLRIGMGEDDSETLTGNNAFGLADRSALHSTQRQYTWQNDFSLPLGMLTLAYDRLEQHVDGSTNFTLKSRDNNGWLASYLLDQGAHILQASARLDDNSQYGNHTSGWLSYGYRFSDQWRATASYGTAFKAPSFNDLYWPDQGNPNLMPETSRNKEFSVHYQKTSHELTITAYDNKVEGLIDWAPIAPGSWIWKPSNVNKASLRGLTTSYSGTINNYYLHTSIDIQSPRDDETGHLLARRAQRHGTASIRRQFGRLSVGGEVIASSYRYNTTNNNASDKLDGYAIVNLIADYIMGTDWTLEARANNVFDKEYALAKDYNTPGANLFVGLRWQPK